LGLQEYEKKRDFRRTPEPKGRRKPAERAARSRGSAPAAATALQFVVQQHAARRMHWDFRLELDGVLKSWAVPKGPSLVAGERRMAAQTEDHPLEYATFEGVIPKGEYGGGTVIVWDRGYWQPIGDAHKGLAKGKLDFTLAGEKLRGRFHLVRMRAGEKDRGRASWLLIKGRDAEARPAAQGAVVATERASVLSGRELDEVARDADRVWSSGKGEQGEAPEIGAPGDPAHVAGARKAAFPAAAELQLATLVDVVPEGDEWVHEIKLDGYRLLCSVRGGKVRIHSRNGLDWTHRFPSLAAALRALPVKAALLDGEAVVFDAHGRTRFGALQEALGRGDPGAGDVSLTAFDCLHLDGWDLRGAALADRKRVLRALLARAPGELAIRFGDHVAGRGDDFFAAACASGLEGIVSKRADAPYRSGRTRSWLKVKCTRRQELVIVGFTEPGGSRTGLGALLLGAHDAKGELRYCGKVGTGFDRASLGALRGKLERIERKSAPVADPPRMRGVHWVAPRLVAEVEFTEWTRDGKIRHPVYLGLRDDKPAADVRIEAATAPPPPVASAPAARGPIAGVTLSSPDRIYWPDVGVTKRELAHYWEAVAERALPGLAQRPLSLVRCPEGIDGQKFYQKHPGKTVPKSVARVKVRDDPEPYAMVTDLASVISLVQIAALELHVQGARADRLDRPDLAVFDLDPDPSVPWERVKETAAVLRALLGEVGLLSFVRTTGGKGVHVVAPLERRSTWEEVRGFTKGIALELVRLAPAQFTAKMSKAGRKGKIFIDWVRNTPEATAIASYSPRARPGAPVAVPLAWEELAELDGPLAESVRDVPARLRGSDPWADFEASRQPLSREALERFGAPD
jgi:bifunctional non-homologous end joining protein LigD